MRVHPFPHRPLVSPADVARFAGAAAQPLVSGLESALAMRRAPARLTGWAEAFESNLRDGILRFWLEHGIDRDHGGLFNWLDQRGRPLPPGTKSIVPYMQALWLFSAAWQRFPDPAYRDLAARTLEFARTRLWDRQRGGFFWFVDREGRLVDDRKHLYGQCFGLFGLAEYARAFGNAEVRQDALDLFDLLEQRAHDDANGSYFPVFSCDWRQRIEGDRFLGAPGGKHQCGQIALLEGLMTLYGATGEARVRVRLEELLDLMLDRLVDAERGFTRVHCSDDWRSLGSDLASYGHDIKVSWLLTAAAGALDRADDPRVHQAARALAEHTLAFGFDRRRGGVYWEGTPRGPVTNRSKVWWPQAEALVGLLNAFELTGEPQFKAAFERQARYVWRHCIDHRHGEWFDGGGWLRRAFGGGKVTIWKSPYHQGRACLEVARRLAAMPAPA